MKKDLDKFVEHMQEVKRYVFCQYSGKLFQNAAKDGKWELAASTKEDIERVLRWRFDGDWNRYRNDPFMDIKITDHGIEYVLEGLQIGFHKARVAKDFEKWFDAKHKEKV